MGGITALLLLAAGGFTYGWKPDNQGGVEYLIQIPRDQLDELRRVGSISSTIDPAVRGHVSTVVLQIGEGPLPRITPPEVLAANGAASGNAMIAASDSDSVPIPEMDARIASAGRQQNQAVMKPQTANPGLTLPPSLGSPAPTSGTTSMNGSGTGTRNVIPPPATRTPVGPPPFTGGTSAAGTGTSMSGTGSSVGAPGYGTSGTSGVGTSGVAGTSNPILPFGASGGITPGIASVRQGGPSTDPTANRDWMQSQTPVTPSTDPYAGTRSAPSSGLNGMASPSATAGNPSTAGGYGTTQNPNPTGASLAAPNPFRTQNSSVMGAGVQNPAMQSASNQNPATANPATTNTGTQNPNVYPPSRSQLTQEEIAAGAWSVDVYGYPIDKLGNRITTTRTPANPPAGPNGVWPNSRTQSQVDPNAGFANRNLRTQSPQFSGPNGALASADSTQAGASAAILRQRQEAAANFANRNGTSQSRGGQIMQASGSQVLPPGGNTSAQGVQNSGYNPIGGKGEILDPPSLTSPSGKAPLESARTARSQDTQPVVTWLLMVSFVSNVYLVFWMKKLLVRYRDLVAAKRVSDSRAAA